MKQQTYLHIPTPCHEDWNKMTQSEKGKFCNACSKQVVDFTLMSDQEVLNYFSKTSGNTETLYFFSSSALLVSSLSALLPVMIRLYPFAANMSAAAFPKPEVAPVINTSLFIKIGLKNEPRNYGRIPDPGIGVIIVSAPWFLSLQ